MKGLKFLCSRIFGGSVRPEDSEDAFAESGKGAQPGSTSRPANAYHVVEWNFSDSLAPTARNASNINLYSLGETIELFDGLTACAIPAAPMDFVAVDKSADGLTFTRELRICGTGYPFGTHSNPHPTRFLKFNVRKACRITVYAASASGGFSLPFVLHRVDFESQQIFWTGTAYCSANFPTRMEFAYDGPAGEMVATGGSGAMNIWYIKIEYGTPPADE